MSVEVHSITTGAAANLWLDGKDLNVVAANESSSWMT